MFFAFYKFIWVLFDHLFCHKDKMIFSIHLDNSVKIKRINIPSENSVLKCFVVLNEMYKRFFKRKGNFSGK